MSDPRIERSPVRSSAGRAPTPTMRASRAAPSTPRAARREIEYTRQEIGDTVGLIRERLQRRADTVREKLDVVSEVRERVRQDPWPLLGAAFAAGLLAGWLTGGRDEPGYESLVGDELDEIRRWRRERRRHLRRLEEIMQRTAAGQPPSLAQRLRNRMQRDEPQDD